MNYILLVLVLSSTCFELLSCGLQPSKKDVQAIQDNSQKVIKKNIAQQCQQELERRAITQHLVANQVDLDTHANQLESVKASQNKIVKLNPDAIVANWLHGCFFLSAKQALLCDTIYGLTMQYQMLQSLQVMQNVQVERRNALIHSMLPQDRATYQDAFKPVVVEVTGLDMYNKQLQEFKDDLQQDIYQENVTDHKRKKDALIYKTHQLLAEKTNLQKKLADLKAEQNVLKQDFMGLKQNHDVIEKMLDEFYKPQCKKWLQLVVKKMQQQKRIENNELDAMGAEDRHMHKIVAHEKQQRKIVERNKVKQEQQEQAETLAMLKEEKLGRDIQEQKRRMRQSQADKERYLLQLQEQQCQKLEQQQQKIRVQVERKKELEQVRKVVKDLKSQADKTADELLQTSIAQVQAQKEILAKIPKLEDRLSYKMFLKEVAKNPEFTEMFQILFETFQANVCRIAAGQLQEKSIEHFDLLYEDIIQNHRKLVAMGVGISYYMAFWPKLYGDIVNSYLQLREKISSQTSVSLSCNFERLQNNLSLGQDEFATLKTSYAAALKNNDTAASSQYLSAMKDKKKSLDLIQQQLHENQILMKQQYVFVCLLKTCGNGGILDPCRFIQPLEKSILTKRAMRLEKLDEYFVILNNQIEDVLKMSDDEQDPEKLDPVLKISMPKTKLVRDQTLQMIDTVLHKIGLADHPKKQEWALKFYNNSRIFSYDDARNYIDLDAYRYSLQKIFNLKKEGCTIEQYNSMQDLFMKLIRLYKNKFHEKP